MGAGKCLPVDDDAVQVVRKLQAQPRQIEHAEQREPEAEWEAAAAILGFDEVEAGMGARGAAMKAPIVRIRVRRRQYRLTKAAQLRQAVALSVAAPHEAEQPEKAQAKAYDEEDPDPGAQTVQAGRSHTWIAPSGVPRLVRWWGGRC